MAGKSPVIGFGNILCLLCLVIIQSSAHLCPKALVNRRCDATCIPNPHSNCAYTPTYPVWFWPNGAFNWFAPYYDGSGVEVGQGAMMSLVLDDVEPQGSWVSGWYGGNHYYPDWAKQTHCACYYARGVGDRWELANYGIAVVKYSSHLPVASVCKAYWTDCPKSNESAFERWGPPYIERYQGCQTMGSASTNEHAAPSPGPTSRTNTSTNASTHTRTDTRTNATTNNASINRSTNATTNAHANARPAPTPPTPGALRQQRHLKEHALQVSIGIFALVGIIMGVIWHKSRAREVRIQPCLG